MNPITVKICKTSDIWKNIAVRPRKKPQLVFPMTLENILGSVGRKNFFL